MRRARKPGRPAQVRRVTATEDAREYAYERGLDLVEVAADSDPPVCRAMDYGKR